MALIDFYVRTIVRRISGKTENHLFAIQFLRTFFTYAVSTHTRYDICELEQRHSHAIFIGVRFSPNTMQEIRTVRSVGVVKALETCDRRVQLLEQTNIRQALLQVFLAEPR